MRNTIIDYKVQWTNGVTNNGDEYVIPNYTVLKCKIGDDPVVVAELSDIVEVLHFCKNYYTMVKPDNSIRLVIHNHATRDESYYANPSG
jgi:hypothetical protein